MIELRNVSHSYGGEALLTDMSLALAPGSFHFLTGPSGAGKTTLLRICYGELVPSGGQVLLFGSDLRDMARDDVALVRRRIGVVHQDCRFLDHLPVAENVALPLAVAGRDPAAHAGELGELLGWVGLSGQAGDLPPSLSGGERQRAALARAVIMSPEVLLADEPTGNLDEHNGKLVMDALREYARAGGAVLVVTHDRGLHDADAFHLVDGALTA